MLVLSRKNNEAVVIQDNIKVIVLGVQGQQVRLGFEAPPEISVHRSEVYAKIQQGKNHAKQVK
jgi:carbon storage regulator